MRTLKVTTEYPFLVAVTDPVKTICFTYMGRECWACVPTHQENSVKISNRGISELFQLRDVSRESLSLKSALTHSLVSHEGLHLAAIKECFSI